MRSFAEDMIVKIVQEESRIRQDKITLQVKIDQEKKQKTDTSAMRLFLNMNVNNEWLWRLVAYTYFICKTLGLFILIDVFIFRRPAVVLFALLFLCCYYLNSKLYRLYLVKRLRNSPHNQLNRTE